MNIEHLRAFLEVAATGSFQLAAEKMFITQSTASARIKSLEDRLNRVLFIRNPNGAELTPAGRHLYPHAQTAVSAWERARQDVTLSDELTGVFSLGIQLNYWDVITPMWLEWMQKEAPLIAPGIVSDYSETLMRKLRDGLLDMAILCTPHQHSNLNIEKLMEEPIILVSTREEETDEIRGQGYVFVDWNGEFRDQHALIFPQAPVPHLSVGLGSVGLNYILKTGGSGYFLESMVNPFIEQGKLYKIKKAPVFTHQLYLVTPQNPASPDMLKIAKKVIKKLVPSTINKCR